MTPAFNQLEKLYLTKFLTYKISSLKNVFGNEFESMIKFVGEELRLTILSTPPKLSNSSDASVKRLLSLPECLLFTIKFSENRFDLFHGQSDDKVGFITDRYMNNSISPTDDFEESVNQLFNSTKFPIFIYTSLNYISTTHFDLLDDLAEKLYHVIVVDLKKEINQKERFYSSTLLLN